MTVNDHNQISFAELFPLFLNLNWKLVEYFLSQIVED
jgi:hypothetical protein